MRSRLMQVLLAFLLFGEFYSVDASAMGIFTTRGREERARERNDPVKPPDQISSPTFENSPNDPKVLGLISSLKTADDNGCTDDKGWQKAEKRTWYLRCVRGCGDFSYYMRVQQTKDGRIEDFSVDRVPRGANPKDYTSIKDIFSNDLTYKKGRIVNCSRSEKTESATRKVEAMAAQLIRGLKCPEQKSVQHSDGSFHQGMVELSEEAKENPQLKNANVCLSKFNEYSGVITNDKTKMEQYKNYLKIATACGRSKTFLQEQLMFANRRLAWRNFYVGRTREGKEQKDAAEVACSAISCGGMEMIRSTAYNNLTDCDGPFYDNSSGQATEAKEGDQEE